MQVLPAVMNYMVGAACNAWVLQSACKFACCARILHEILHAVNNCEHAKNWNRKHIFLKNFCWPAKKALLHENNLLKDIEESKFVFWIACRGLIGYIFTQLQCYLPFQQNCQKLGSAVYATPYLLYTQIGRCIPFSFGCLYTWKQKITFRAVALRLPFILRITLIAFQRLSWFATLLGKPILLVLHQTGSGYT